MMKVLKWGLAAAFVLAALAVAALESVDAQGPPPLSCRTGDSLACESDCRCYCHRWDGTCCGWVCETFYWPDL